MGSVKWCPKCERDTDDWYPGRSSWCAECHRQASNDRRKTKRDELRDKEAERRDRLRAAGKCFRHPKVDAVTKGACEDCRREKRESVVRKTYNMSLREYEALMATASCEVCSEQPPEIKLHLDHDHTTGRVRGVLCSRCNHALGLLKDSPERIDSLKRYLTKER